MRQRTSNVIVVFCFLFVLQAGIVAYGMQDPVTSETLLCIALMFASAIVDIVIARSMLGRLRYIERSYIREVENQLEESLEAYAERAERANQVSLKLARGIDKELAAAQNALGQGNVDLMSEHIDKSIALASQAMSPRCNNAVVSAVLSSKAQQCEDAGIDFRTYVTLPVDLPIEDTEIAAIFLHLIDNAMRECQALVHEGTHPQRLQITVSSKIQAGQFFAEVTSSCVPENGVSPLWPSQTAKRFAARPLGLSTVSDIVAIHGGVTSYDDRDGSLAWSIMFPLPEA